METDGEVGMFYKHALNDSLGGKMQKQLGFSNC